VPVARSPGPPAATAQDPVCGMTVPIGTARHRSEAPDGPVYFCCGGCKQQYDRDPGRYAAPSPR
jgi:YHS domain-containing protein